MDFEWRMIYFLFQLFKFTRAMFNIQLQQKAKKHSISPIWSNSKPSVQILTNTNSIYTRLYAIFDYDYSIYKLRWQHVLRHNEIEGRTVDSVTHYTRYSVRITRSENETELAEKNEKFRSCVRVEEYHLLPATFSG